MTEYVLVSDIHGNFPALREVRNREGLSANYIVLGDIHGLNSYPRDVMEMLGVIKPEVMLAGNHDKAIFHHHEGHVNNDALSRFERDETLNALSPQDREKMRSLPHMEVFQDGDSRIAAAHAVPWPEQASGYEAGNAGVPKGNVPHFASIVADDYDIVLSGHTHEQYSLDCERFGHDVLFVNPGSLGWDGNYAILNTETKEVKLKSVEYDKERVRKHIQSVLPENAPHTKQWY